MAHRVYGGYSAAVSSQNVPARRHCYGGAYAQAAGSVVSIPTAASRKTSKVTTAVCGALMSVFVVSGAVMGIMAFQSNQDVTEIVQSWDAVRDIADSPVISNISDQTNISGIDSIINASRPEAGNMDSDEAYVFDPMDREINWEALYAINDQIKCWIYIPGTNIDYPIIQEKEIGTYQYLDHDIYGNYEKSGCIVTPRQPDGNDTSDAHFIVLGHNMKNATMFGTLRKYKTKDFYEANPNIYVYYPDHTEQWSVWAAYHTTEADIIYDMPYELNTPAFEKLVNQIENQKSYSTNIINTDSMRRVLTLSTCEDSDGTRRGRFVVNAVLDIIKNGE